MYTVPGAPVGERLPPPPAPVRGTAEGQASVARLHEVEAELERAPAVFEYDDRRKQPAPPPPPVPPPPSSLGKPRTVPVVLSREAQTLQTETARLERVEGMLAAQHQVVSDRLTVLRDLDARVTQLQEDAAALNDVTHRLKGENDALLVGVQEALAAVGGGEASAPPAAPTASQAPPPAMPVTGL